MIIRDFLATLKVNARLEAVLLWGPRQVGKTTLLDQLSLGSRLFLDDLSIRQRAQEDPALTLDNVKLPCLIDEAQYAPNLFPEIKLRIDEERRSRLKTTASQPSSTKQVFSPSYYLTGSNRVQLDRKVKESLAGRSHNYTLHGLSVQEIRRYHPSLPLPEILLRGGFPELYTRQDLQPVHFLNDYITSFIEKDIAFSAGIHKLDEFHTVLKLLAARTGQFFEASTVAAAAGVDLKTIQSWIGFLERSAIVQRIPPYTSNLSKRVVKMKKFYFIDVGICARLQGQTSSETAWNSAQSGSLFETMVFSELIKTRDNFLKDWSVATWRTKDQHEIDFILQRGPDDIVLIESKLAIHGAKPFKLDPEAMKVFSQPVKKVVVTAGGSQVMLDQETMAVPLGELGAYLLKELP